MKAVDTSFISSSEADTIAIGRRLSAALEPGDVLCFSGDLGAGKTHLIKGIASGLGVPEKSVHSPTFTLIHEYAGALRHKTSNNLGEPTNNLGETPIPIYHFDAYRLNSAAEAQEIGTEDYLYGDGICLIEWPEKIASLIPRTAIHVIIQKTGRDERYIRLAGWMMT